MSMNKALRMLPALLFIVNSMFCYGQNGGGIDVKAVKPSFDWNEKIGIQFSGLPAREASSGGYDDIIIVPSGTPDDNYYDAQRVRVNKTSGEVELLGAKAGSYEARVYLYEKPGIVSARSAPFKVLAVEEGKLETKSYEALAEIARRSRSRDKDLMCRSVSEYFRRNPASNEPNYAGMKALQTICPVKTNKPVTAPAGNSYPIVARYQCYRILSTGNEIAEDIFILAGNTYKTMNKTGKYTYNPKTRILTFTSGPLYIPSEKWVGIYTGKGEPTPAGGRTVDSIIEIRRQADVVAGNKKVLQICSCAE